MASASPHQSVTVQRLPVTGCETNGFPTHRTLSSDTAPPYGDEYQYIPETARSRTTHATFVSNTPAAQPQPPPAVRFTVPSLRDVLHRDMALRGDGGAAVAAPQEAQPPSTGGAPEVRTVILVPEVDVKWYWALPLGSMDAFNAAAAADVASALLVASESVVVANGMADPNGTLLTVRLLGDNMEVLGRLRVTLDELVARGMLRLTHLTDAIRRMGWVPEGENSAWQREQMILEKLCLELEHAMEGLDLARAEATLGMLLQSQYPNARYALMLQTINKFVPSATLEDATDRSKSTVLEYIMSKRPKAEPEPMRRPALPPHPALGGLETLLRSAAEAAADVEGVYQRQKEHLHQMQAVEAAPRVVYQGRAGRVLADAPLEDGDGSADLVRLG
eukprot:TRINITY_DN20340_c0_g1_i1.p2 TRINITY_DN20340_c0_g1~~TRINITY_DN20340_c0_g1_i1.p2  ORF type:complete len:391 (+),score=119.84 TRINITY_DN20340_c0_g1_i1:61-1233(+)